MSNLNIRMLDHYGLQNGLNSGVTMKELCKKYACTPEDVESQIKRLYSNNYQMAKRYMGQLKKNTKKSKKPKAEKISAEIDKAAQADELGAVEATQTESAKAPEAIVAERPETSSSAKEILSSIARDREAERYRITEKLKKKGIEVVDSESEFNTASSTLCVVDRKLRAQSQKLDDLNEQYNKEYKVFLDIVSEREVAAQHLDDCLLKLSDDEAALDKLRQEATEPNTLVVFVYSDGKVVIVDGDHELQMTEFEGFSSKYDELLDMPECENLRLKDVKTLAKVLTLKDMVESPLVIDITFDENELAEAYRSMA